MAKISKRMKQVRQQYDKAKIYAPDDALKLLTSLSNTKFLESVDAAIILGVDPKKSDQAVRGASILPNGTGKTMRVAVFAQGPNADKARAAGADAVGFEDLAEELKQKADSGKIDYDVIIATPDAMRIVGLLGRVLGPRGLMPNPKVGTVTTDVEKAVNNAKSGQVTFRADKGGIIHCTIGKANFTVQALRENLDRLMADLRRAKPSTSKGVYFKKVILSTTMGPGLVVDKSSLDL
ncbi:50S ribosomal protein L1 [Candidatus Berkiella cookevillensis]|uniref:Large ribosomal subunit protein uL1 n=1 Tax=Candidatus Berkiella cookevillensis TaxID=437022 RepID=A0A0Q9YEW2_9GAMM|nr:50S ribosomal protein L1 [Candidatus Berkiella cookevillensis]MCS5709403.1 50S ribosomal protein L1 [Candidatus Berkiella cookevillensis]